MSISSFYWLSLGAALGGLGMWRVMRLAVAAERDRRWDAECEVRREQFRRRYFLNVEPYKFASLAELVGQTIQEGE